MFSPATRWRQPQSEQQRRRIFLQDKQSRFKSVSNPVFEQDFVSEDVDAIFFDADGDQLPDLYVVSGGNDFFGKAEAMRDRLYLNAGNGRFIKSAGLLPEIYANGACVAPIDVDNDGDIDLFVASRSRPRLYGLVPESHLLINDGQGKFTDETSALAPDLSKVGMVTDAIWLDLPSL